VRIGSSLDLEELLKLKASAVIAPARLWPQVLGIYHTCGLADVGGEAQKRKWSGTRRVQVRVL